MRRFDMFVPENMADLLGYLDKNQSGVQMIANGTDLINRIQRRQVTARVLVDLSGLHELKYVKRDQGTVRIGALTTISELIASPIITERYGAFREVASKFGGPSIINMATVGGNICSASSSEDLLPVLLVLEAQVLVRSIKGDRIIPLADFVKGKRTTAATPNEVLVETRFPELPPASTCSFEKVGMRNSLIIAFVNCAVYIKLNLENKRIGEIRIAFNRVAGKIPERAKTTENSLRGQKPNEQLITGACDTLRHELKLTSDSRASEEYRVEVACSLFKRALNNCMRKLSGATIIV